MPYKRQFARRVRKAFFLSVTFVATAAVAGHARAPVAQTTSPLPVHPGTLALIALTAVSAYVGREVFQIHSAKKAIADREVDDLLSALDEAPDGFAQFASDGRLTFASSRFADILRRRSTTLRGDPLHSFVVESDRALFAEALEIARRDGRSQRDLRIACGDGTIIPARLTLVRKQDRLGVCFVRDMTEQRKIEEALRLSEERFNLVSRATRDVITDWDVMGDTLWTSEAARTMFDYPEDVRLSVDFWIDAVHPQDRPLVLSSHAEALANGADLWTCEYRMRRGDGTYAFVYDRTYIVRNEFGVPVRMVGVIMDDSSRKAAEEERLSMQNSMIVESVAEGIIGVDGFGRVMFVNASAQAVLGSFDDAVIGAPIDELLHHEATDGRPLGWIDSPPHESIQSGREVTSKATIHRKDHSVMPVELISRPLRTPHGEIAGAVVTFRDITQRLEVERMKNEFISVVSHELRTPLTSIRGALGIVVGGLTGGLSDKARRMLDIAMTNTDRLVRLVSDILDLERIESGRVQISRQRCIPSMLMMRAVEELRPVAQKSRVRIVVNPCDAELDADPDRVLQTLTNLIGNAIKFSPPGGTVWLSAQSTPEGIRFTVADEGRGIPRDKLDAIFERFHQVDASDSREKGGSGLGLAICRSIVGEHGGKIWAESELGRGSRFMFTIPAERDVAA